MHIPEEVFYDSYFSIKVKIIKAIAFDSYLENLKIGDQVMVYSKAFNPIITRLK